jgi:hypothetical protein
MPSRLGATSLAALARPAPGRDPADRGDKTGRDDFYERLIPVADRLYDEHLAEIAAEANREKRDDGG